MRTPKEAAPVYEYNSSNKVVDATLVNGWATFEYKLNPANVILSITQE